LGDFYVFSTEEQEQVVPAGYTRPLRETVEEAPAAADEAGGKLAYTKYKVWRAALAPQWCPMNSCPSAAAARCQTRR